MVSGFSSDLVALTDTPQGHVLNGLVVRGDELGKLAHICRWRDKWWETELPS